MDKFRPIRTSSMQLVRDLAFLAWALARLAFLTGAAFGTVYLLMSL